MAIGRTFKEALQKGLRSLERGYSGWNAGPDTDMETLREKLRTPNPDRVLLIKNAFEMKMSEQEIFELTAIDPWYLRQMKEIYEAEQEIKKKSFSDLSAFELKQYKQLGFSDQQLSELLKDQPDVFDVYTRRQKLGVNTTYKLVDTCAAEFQAMTPYFYSSWEDEDEAAPDKKQKVMILGSGPNRIGQGIEFDYACVHCSMALREAGYETIMVNSNPETVSTDYDISDKLYFEPLTFEDVMNIYEREKPLGVVLQFGGQTPLKLALPLQKAGVKILGTSPDAIDLAEDRDRFHALIEELGFKQPPSATATSLEGALKIAKRIGYPILARPSYVLGGRAMLIVYNPTELENYMRDEAAELKHGPILIDKFLENAQEVDVDAVGDGENVVVSGIMQHIEQAGIHSGDSAMILPPTTIEQNLIDEMVRQTVLMGKRLNVKGLMNIQFAIKDNEIYFIEVNPRASRTVPFVSKATGIPWAKIASRVMMGEKLADLGLTEYNPPKHIAVKEVVLPFNKFPEVDTVLSPEMKSTGEVMGLDTDFGRAFLKSQIAAGMNLPRNGKILLTLNGHDKASSFEAIRQISLIGYSLIATKGTAKYLRERGVDCDTILKVHEGRPNIIDAMKNGEIDLIFNTPVGEKARVDDTYIRKTATVLRIPLVTTVQAIHAMARGLEALHKGNIDVRSLQEFIQK